MRRILIGLLLASGYWLSTGLPVFAQAGTDAGVNLKDTYIKDTNNLYGENSVYDLLNAVLPNVYIIAGLILFLYAVVGGFLLISAGSNPDQAKNGQKIISNAIIGFIILFASYWLIQIIEIVTGVKILDPTLTI